MINYIMEHKNRPYAHVPIAPQIFKSSTTKISTEIGQWESFYTMRIWKSCSFRQEVLV